MNTSTPRPRFFTLNDPQALRINRELAAEIGFNESVMLLQIEFLIGTSTTEERDGNLWTYQSLADLQEKYFPWWSTATIGRILNHLEELDLILIGNYNRLSMDRTQWFALNLEACNRLASIKIDYSSFQDEKSARTRKHRPSPQIELAIEPETVEESPISQNEKCISQNEICISQNDTCISHFETTIPENTTENTSEIPTENHACAGSKSSEPASAVPEEERTFISQFLACFLASKFETAGQLSRLLSLRDSFGAARVLECARWAAGKRDMTLTKALKSMTTALPGWGSGPSGESAPAAPRAARPTALEISQANIAAVLLGGSNGYPG